MHAASMPGRAPERESVDYCPTGLQIAGVVITAIAVTAYAATQWWSSRQAQQELQRSDAAAAAVEPALEENGAQHNQRFIHNATKINQ